MVDILESKVVGTNKETWYKLVGTSEDTKPIGEFPAGTGHTVANGSRFYEVDTEIGYELKEEGWIAVGQNVRLPDVTAEDNGKVLSVVEGNWDKAQPTNELPDVTEDDNDKVLKVVNGAWDKAEAGGGDSIVVFDVEQYYKNTDTYYRLKDEKTRQDVENVLAAGKIPVLKYTLTNQPSVAAYMYYADTTIISGENIRRFTTILVNGLSRSGTNIHTLQYAVSNLSSSGVEYITTRISTQS